MRNPGWPEDKVGKGIEVIVIVDPELKEIIPNAVSQKLGHFLERIMAWHYAPNMSTSIDTRVEPWPLPATVAEAHARDNE
jgi:hypothetical protein